MSEALRAPSLESRVAKSEANIESLAADVRQLAGSISTFKDAVFARLDRLAEAQAASGKTNWGNMIAAVGVLAIFLGMISTVAVREFSRGEAATRDIGVIVARHDRELGERLAEIAARNLDCDRRIAENRARIERLEDFEREAGRESAARRVAVPGLN